MGFLRFLPGLGMWGNGFGRGLPNGLRLPALSAAAGFFRLELFRGQPSVRVVPVQAGQGQAAGGFLPRPPFGMGRLSWGRCLAWGEGLSVSFELLRLQKHFRQLFKGCRRGGFQPFLLDGHGGKGAAVRRSSRRRAVAVSHFAGFAPISGAVHGDSRLPAVHQAAKDVFRAGRIPVAAAPPSVSLQLLAAELLNLKKQFLADDGFVGVFADGPLAGGQLFRRFLVGGEILPFLPLGQVAGIGAVLQDGFDGGPLPAAVFPPLMRYEPQLVKVFHGR